MKHYSFELEFNWRSMMEKAKTNRKIKICEDWQDLDKFAEWWEENYYKVDDQKMFFTNNLVEKSGQTFSPETCFIIPKKLHNLFSYRNPLYKKRNTSGTPIGVSTKNGKYLVQIRNSHKNTVQHIGSYNTPEEGFLAFKIAKESIIRDVVNEYKPKIPSNVYEMLMHYKVELDD